MKLFATESPVSIDDFSRMHTSFGKMGGGLKVTYKHAYVACISLETFLELARQLSENCFSVLVFAVLIYTISVGL